MWIKEKQRTLKRREQSSKNFVLILRSMKLHVAAGADILNKGLDPSFPHNQLGADGLLVVPSPVEKVQPPITIPELITEIQTPVDVQIATEVQEPVSVPVKSEQEVKPLEIPVEEEKKPGKVSKTKKP